jgi:DNA excision repair protein ERCC-2
VQELAFSLFKIPRWAKGNGQIRLFGRPPRRARLFRSPDRDRQDDVRALSFALKAFAKGENRRIFYLTAKSSGREAASEALGRLYEKGLVARDSLLTAKDKICFSLGKACNPDECPFAKDYYTKLPKVLEEALASKKRFSFENVVSWAKHHAVCPFELQLDLSLWADVIICDYNYLFDPLVHLERFFGDDADPSHDLALVDEAHNLVDRGRDMYSASLSAMNALS